MELSRFPGRELCFFFAVCFLPCCDRVAEDASPTAEDIRVARSALSLQEVSLLLRTGSSQSELVAEIKRRHVSEKMHGITEDRLILSGANDALIAALKSDENILTPKQKIVFDRYKTERATLAEQTATARRNEAKSQVAFERDEQKGRQ